tara:strand:+ start:513 stop:1175 length:663 start_codon:yes stop_codon:yes gene_type:complete
MNAIDIVNLKENDWQRIRNQYVNDTPNKEEKEAALKIIVHHLNNNKINYFISGGTLLGIYRDGALIEWDYDIDLDILRETYKELLAMIKIISKKYNYPYRIGNNIFHPKISIFINKVKVSISCLTQGIVSNRYMYRPRTRIKKDICYPTKDYFYKKEIHIKVPNDINKYLISLYGESWRKPVKWVADDQNKYYEKGYHRKEFRYRLLEYLQLLISKNFNK